MNTRWVVLWCCLVVAGCQSTHDQLLAEGYPPAFADGFQDGCGSGRQSVDLMKGQYKRTCRAICATRSTRRAGATDSVSVRRNWKIAMFRIKVGTVSGTTGTGPGNNRKPRTPPRLIALTDAHVVAGHLAKLIECDHGPTFMNVNKGAPHESGLRQ